MTLTFFRAKIRFLQHGSSCSQTNKLLRLPRTHPLLTERSSSIVISVTERSV